MSQVMLEELGIGIAIRGPCQSERFSGCEKSTECSFLLSTESYLYRYSWDLDDLKTYPWYRHYVYQPEVLDYLRHVTGRHDLRKDMYFNTAMEAAD